MTRHGLFCAAAISFFGAVGCSSGGSYGSFPSEDAAVVGVSSDVDAAMPVPRADAAATGTRTDGCVPDPTDCAGKCGAVVDPCGFAVDCGPCPTQTDASSKAPPPTTGEACQQTGDEQCDCEFGAAPNSAPCGPSQVDSSICCASSEWPSTGACFCETWGCTGASCGLGLGTATSAEAPAGSICCAYDSGPACNCYANATSCPTGFTEVSVCDRSTAACGAGYTYPETVGACR